MAARQARQYRYADIGSLAVGTRRVLNRTLAIAVTCLGLIASKLFFDGHPGGLAFALISVGFCATIFTWKGLGEGLPVVPMLALQTLIAYSLPIVLSNETIMIYSENDMTNAGIEVLAYCCAMAVGWSVGMRAIETSSSTCYALQGFNEDGMTKVGHLGIMLISCGATFELLRSLGLLDFLLSSLPSGSNSIINVLLSAINACGFFLSAMLVGKNLVSNTARLLFWSLLGFQSYIGASSLLLSTTTTLIFAVIIGLFWGSGRVPWRFITFVLAILAFLNLGKTTMRERYWQLGDDGADRTVSLANTPGMYVEWIEACVDGISGEAPDAAIPLKGQRESAKGQRLSDRVNNLQNLLFAIDAMGQGRIPALGGATYSLIPPLLVPRVLWPNKPRSHAGQVMLNVHFGRQDLYSTGKTYIAWGILAEAYGNFGPIKGALLLGGFIGFFFAWIEKITARKLLLSMEGFLAFTLFLAMANSFEMVASVLVTSVFQGLIPVVIATKPFVELVTPSQSIES